MHDNLLQDNLLKDDGRIDHDELQRVSARFVCRDIEVHGAGVILDVVVEPRAKDRFVRTVLHINVSKKDQELRDDFVETCIGYDLCTFVLDI